MSILLLGATGYLGSYLVHNMSCDTLPRHTHYDHVINCVGKPDLEYCEQYPGISYEANFKYLQDMIAKFPDSKFIHFSSYYVYEGWGLCKEDSGNTTRDYNYTRDKLDSELIVKETGVVFRIGKLFGNPYSDQRKLTEAAMTKSNLTVDQVHFNPTSVAQVLDAVRHEIIYEDLTGIYNLACSHPTTHEEYVKYIGDKMGIEQNLNVVEVLDRFRNYGFFCMDTSKIAKYITLRDWHKEMDTYIEEREYVTKHRRSSRQASDRKH
jgi:dTDP-4-dehydrorhamnose reductase